MKRVEVLIPFHNKDTNVNQVAGDIIEVSEEKLAGIRAINVNMVLVLGDVEETGDEVPEAPEEEPTDELKEELKEEPKTVKKTTKKTKTTK